MEDDITITANSPLVFDTMDTITLGNGSGLTQTWAEPHIEFGSILGKRKAVDNETVISFKVSPLAIILQLLDNGTETWQVMDTMLGVSVEELDITDANVKLADEIKEYYRAKIITDTLSSQRQRTDYRSSLMMSLALLDVYQTKRSFIPILIKLRDFYCEDMAMEKLTSNHVSLSKELGTSNLVNEQTVTLRLVEQVTVNKRSLKVNNFFFADSDNRLYVLNTELKNTLIPFLGVLKDKELTLRCRTKPTNMRFYNFYFYSILDKFEVLEIK